MSREVTLSNLTFNRITPAHVVHFFIKELVRIKMF